MLEGMPVQRFKICWKDGKRESLEGVTLMHALLKSGYNAQNMPVMESYASSPKRSSIFWWLAIGVAAAIAAWLIF